MKKFLPQSSGGYTLIETMIAISLFIVIILAGMTSLLSAAAVHQKSQDLRSIMDSLSFITEDISRNLRTGSQFYCITGSDNLSNVSVAKSSPAGANCWGIAFEAQGGDPNNSNDQWVYFIDNSGKMWKSTQGPYNTLTNFVQLTPAEVQLNTSASGFLVLGAESPTAGNYQQPLVIIKLSGTITYKNTITPFSIETAASQRLIDI
jgi:type II secretory pathway pseudopilin PulG